MADNQLFSDNGYTCHVFEREFLLAWREYHDEADNSLGD